MTSACRGEARNTIPYLGMKYSPADTSTQYLTVKESHISLYLPVHVVSWGGNVHHLHSATGQSKSQRPQRAFSGGGKNIRESTKSRNQKVLWVSKFARPAPVDQVVNPGESPLNLVLLEVHLGKSCWPSVPGRNQVYKQVKSGGDLPWTESSHGSQLCRECLTPGSDSLESPEWTVVLQEK